MTDTQTARDDLATDLRATLAARRELGPEMDDELVELLMTRVDGYVQHQLKGASPVRRHEMLPEPPTRRRSVSRSGPFTGVPVLILVVLAFLLIGPGLGFLAAHAFPVVVALILIAVFSSRGRRRRHDPRST